MANTTYDQVWTSFLLNCKVSDIDLPKTNEKIYETIQNAVMHFNNRLRTEVICDDVLEQLSRELTDDELLILSHFLRLIFLTNQKTYFENLWQPFQKDVGLKNFGTQLKSLEGSVSDQSHKIETLILNSMEDFL